MIPGGNLLDLTEPAYVLLGTVLPGGDPDVVELLVSVNSAVPIGPEARPVLEYFSAVRGRSEAVERIKEWEGTPEDLDHLVTDRRLVLLPDGGGGQLVAALGPLAVRVTAPAKASADGRSIMLLLPEGRAILVDPVTATVLSSALSVGLQRGVDAVADELQAPAERIWRLVLHDLSAILQTGAGHLLLPEGTS